MARAHIASGGVDAWREDYNTVRPHRGLGSRTPAEYAALMQRNQELESALTTPA